MSTVHPTPPSVNNLAALPRDTRFGDLPIGAVAVAMSIGKLVQVRKEVVWKNGSRATNARKLDGRRGLAFVWPDSLVAVISLPTAEETAAVLRQYQALRDAEIASSRHARAWQQVEVAA